MASCIYYLRSSPPFWHYPSFIWGVCITHTLNHVQPLAMCVYSISSHNTEMEDKSRSAQKSILTGYDIIHTTLLYRVIHEHL